MKINRLGDLEIFVRAAEQGSFSSAARQLGLSPVVASAMIKRLEDGLGVRLFERSTRHVRLSEAGTRYLPHARQALEALQWGEAALTNNKAEAGYLSGPLRLSLPSDMGHQYLVAWIEDFLARQGNSDRIMVELRMSDGLSDLIQQPVDFALRYGLPRDSGLIALPIAPQNRRMLCASPDYLSRYGEPDSLASLKNHNCLRYFLHDQAYSRWRFAGDSTSSTPDAPLEFEASGYRVANDGSVVRQWALAGLGIAYKSQLDIAADLESGRLVPVMPWLQGERSPLYLLAVSRQQLTGGIRNLAADLAERCQQLLNRLESTQGVKQTKPDTPQAMPG